MQKIASAATEQTKSKLFHKLAPLWLTLILIGNPSAKLTQWEKKQQQKKSNFKLYKKTQNLLTMKAKYEQQFKKSK